jgi:hypothetical protein
MSVMNQLFSRLSGLLLFVFALSVSQVSWGQTKTQQIHKLSGKAKKGYMFEAYLNDNGNIELVYNIKSGKDKVVYEIYEFDKNLGLIGVRDEVERKPKGVVKPDRTFTQIYATVGGGTSFTILSTKLNLFQRTVNRTWDVEKQRYKVKVSETKEFKPKNAENKTFNGNASYRATDGSLWVLASSEKTDKKDKSKEYSLLHVKTDLTLDETPINFDRQHVLVYTLIVPKGGMSDEDQDEDAEEEDGDMLFFFAPTEGDLKQYSLVQFDAKGKLVRQTQMAVPGNLTTFSAHRTLSDGTIYLVGLSIDEPKKTFSSAIGEWAPIENPSYTQYGVPNYRHETLERNVERIKFSQFVTAKIKDGNVVWLNATPINDFKSKLRVPSNQKGGYSYDGKRFVINGFQMMPDEGFLITGQVKVPVFKQAPKNIQYRDVLVLRFDNKGNLLAQFSYKPTSLGDSKSIIYPIPQEFVASADGKSMYWINYEVKTFSGHASFYDAMNGITTFYPNYYPAVVKLDLQGNTMGKSEVMGDKKFFLNKRNMYVNLPSEKARVYIGEDKKGKIMLAKFTLE